MDTNIATMIRITDGLPGEVSYEKKFDADSAARKLSLHKVKREVSVSR